jgi:hypothetical protein
MTWRWPLVLACVLLGASGCGRYEEIARMPSPDGLIEAVVVEVETGAGNPYVYQVHLVARGGAWQKGRERLVYSDPVRFRVTWVDPRHLELCFDDARILPGPQRPDPKPGQPPEDLVDIRLVKPAADCPSLAPRS